MCEDGGYRDTALRNRGKFAEAFSHARLEVVFGKQAVFSDVRIPNAKGKDAGEIDTLVLFGDRAIIVQAKSKRMTLEARKGNDNQIRGDFRRSVQDSYDQALTCAKALVAADRALIAKDGANVLIPQNLKEIYLICVVSDHYPALSFQARQFLRYESNPIIQLPFVLDVFTLDAITEMLHTPIFFLSYVNRRANYQEKLFAPHELTILSFHLKRNLRFEEKYNLIQLTDDLTEDLDIAMLARREGMPGGQTPDGILTRFEGTRLGEILKAIESRPDSGTINLGFALLTLGEEAGVNLCKAIDRMTGQARMDGRHHNLAMPIGESGEGLTFHCNTSPVTTAGPTLERHCLLSKYRAKAERWYGVCIAPNGSLRFGLNFDFRWEHDEKMEDLMSAHPRSGWPMDMKNGRRLRIGRNAPCPCGSGRKFKKCCSR